MAYTPELSRQQSCTLRRIAWALDITMTKAMDTIFVHLIKVVDHKKICRSCRDKTKCESCAFNKKSKKTS